ncbi:hypothetical protein KNE206_57080 [Kitasatospora sp. NE20-6]|uniref:type I polyketide synthase n=1 Tax=Kitasatospora sp. NE20-6 TaxID=2859066 RepID=UPI0034DC451C
MSDHDPIAVIGMACRFPGKIDSAAAYWRFLLAGRNARKEVPERRWDSNADGPRRSEVVRGTIQPDSFPEDITGFDAEFFGISSPEAELMHPQQRVTLEIAWEALEHAGVPASRLAGTDGSVFMGVCFDDHGRHMPESLPHIEGWMGAGSSMGAVSNRVSHVLDLQGPSVTVNTTGSAALAAVHQACQALRSGETSLALAGEVMPAARPAFSLVPGTAGAISPDRRSVALDANADGHGHEAGCAVIVLKRLENALLDGDVVRAVIRGSAVYQDDRTDGIMEPSQEAQEHMLRQTCARAGVDPLSIGYVEARGTSTRLGDPIEAGALAAVVGAGRAVDEPCPIGSVTSNVGHLESASGVAGLIKVALAVEHGRIPATLLPTGLDPSLPWNSSGLRPVTQQLAWPAPANGGPRRALVTDYGYCGTITCAVVEEAVPQTDQPESSGDPHGPHLYPLSAATPSGVRALAADLADRLEDREAPVLPLTDLGRTLAVHRSHLAARGTVVAADRTELADRLRALSDGRRADGVSEGRIVDGPARGAVWVFSGHGQQWPGMGRELLEGEPEFEKIVNLVDPIVAARMGFSVRAALHSDQPYPVHHAQVLIFVVQVALTAVWRSYGVTPAAVIGHSTGEVAAATVAGILDLPDAARLMCHHSLLLPDVAGHGAMAMVSLSFAETVRRLGDRRDITAAISASPRSTVVSGPAAAVAELCTQWREQGTAVRPVDSDVAFHSPAMDPLMERLMNDLAFLSPGPARLPVYSTVLQNPRSTTARDAAYWVANLRAPVRLDDAVAAAAADGHRAFLEVSAHPVVSQSVLETLDSLAIRNRVMAHSLRRNRPELSNLLDNLGTLHNHGVPVDWEELQPAGRLAELPTRPWQHHRYRFEPHHTQALDDPNSRPFPGGPAIVHGSTRTRPLQTVLDDATLPHRDWHAALGDEAVPADALPTTFLATGARRSAGARSEVPEWDGLEADELLAQVTATVGKVVARELQLSPESLEPRRPLADLGADPLLGTMILRQLEHRFDTELPHTLFRNLPSVHTIATHLVELLSTPQTR